MTYRSFFIGLLFVLLSAGMVSCRPAAETGTPTIEPQVVLTAAAETAVFRMTEASAQTPSPTVTQASPTPETALTQAYATISAQQTQAANLTPSPTVAQASPTLGAGNLKDLAEYVADITIPDGTDFQPGSKFKKTWRIKNAGASTWSTAYAFVYISGDKMDAPDRVSLPSTVRPNETVDISVDMTAPSQVGTYRGYWKLLNPNGKFVDNAVYVEIDVVQAGVTPVVGSPTPTNTGAKANVTNISTSVDTETFTGACPKTFTFTGRFTLDIASTVTYRFEAGSETSGFTFNLPPEQSIAFPAGQQTLSVALDFSESVNGWVRLHITAPVDVTSNQAAFSLTCQP